MIPPGDRNEEEIPPLQSLSHDSGRPAVGFKSIRK